MAPALLWINKTADSASLSHSDDAERLRLLSQAQRVSRLRAGRKASCKRSSRPLQQRKGAKNGFQHYSKPAINQDDELACDLCDSSSGFDDWTEHSHLQSRKREQKRLKHQIKMLPKLDPDWTLEERRGVNYFLEVTVLKIITIRSDAMFWREIVPCLTELHPAFRHLVVAIAATHELLFNTNAYSLNLLALEQCNKATRLLLSSPDLTRSWLIISCILVSAYNLLRCDLTSADMSIESGLKMVARLHDMPSDESSSPQPDWHDEKLRLILMKLGRQHGFKLWAADLTFQFDKTNLASEYLEIETKCVNGPFVDIKQILVSFRTLLVEVVAKVLRNLSRGAFIDPAGRLAQDIAAQMSDFRYFWELYYNQTPLEDRDTRMELKQILLGFYSITLILQARVVSSGEPVVDAQLPTFQRMLQLGEEILAARHAGHPVIYVDRIVNGALFTLAIACREPAVRRRAISLLQSQAKYEDGLVNWLRGVLAQAVTDREERGLNVQCRADIPTSNRVHMVSGQCRADDRAVCLQYCQADAVTEVATVETCTQWDSSCGLDPSAREIDDCLQGIMAAYSMYRKVDLFQAPKGYLRPMLYRGRPVAVVWEEGHLGQQQAS